MTLQRFGQIIKLKPEKYDEYKRLHAAVWSEVLATITACNICNYTIYYKEGYLFAHFEYIGDDFAGDIAKMASDPKTQEWWQVTMPCQERVDSAAEGEWWSTMEELFHTD